MAMKAVTCWEKEPHLLTKNPPWWRTSQTTTLEGDNTTRCVRKHRVDLTHRVGFLCFRTLQSLDMILILAYILQALKSSKKHQGFLEGEEPTGSTLDQEMAQEMAGKYIIVNMVSQRANYVTTLKHNRIHENSTQVPASKFQTQSSTWHRTECQQVESPKVQNPKKLSSSTICGRLRWHIVPPKVRFKMLSNSCAASRVFPIPACRCRAWEMLLTAAW